MLIVHVDRKEVPRTYSRQDLLFVLFVMIDFCSSVFSKRRMVLSEDFTRGVHFSKKSLIHLTK